MSEDVLIENKSVREYRRTTKDERRAHVELWNKSGLSMKEYCRDKQIAISRFSEWARRFSTEEKLFKPVSVKFPAPATPNNMVEIQVNQQLKIRCINVTDSRLVVSIAKGLLACNL